MKRLSIFYLLPLFCISFAPAQADYEKVCDLTRASVIDSANPKASRKFDSGRITLSKSFKAAVGKLYFQAEDSKGSKSREFQMDPRSSVFIENEIVARTNKTNIKLTLAGDTSTFYRSVFSLDEFPETFDNIAAFTVDGKTLGITAIKAKKDSDVWIFAAVIDDTPHLVFSSQRVKSMSHNCLTEDMTFSIEAEANKRVPIVVEFDTIGDANAFHEYVEETAILVE